MVVDDVCCVEYEFYVKLIKHKRSNIIYAITHCIIKVTYQG